MKRFSRWTWAFFVVVAMGVWLRCLHIDKPFLIDFHSFRQAETASFSHNYLIDSFAPWHPADSRYPCRFFGQRFGWVESELPLPSWLAVVPLKILGMTFPPAVYLRCVWIAYFVVSCIYMWRLVRRLDGRESTALCSVLAYAVFPLSIFFGRAIMPDAPSLTMGLMALDHLALFLEKRRRRDEVITVVVAAALLLSKISNAYVAFPFVYVLCRREGIWGAIKQPRHWIWFVCIAVPVAAWYANARHAPWTFGIWDHPTASKFTDWRTFTDSSIWARFWNRLRYQILGWPGIGLSVLGLLVARNSEAVRVAFAWFLGYVVFFLLAMRGNAMHVYYQLPLVVPAGMASGAAIAWLMGTPMRGTPSIPGKARFVSAAALAGLLFLHYQVTWAALDPEINQRDFGFFRDRGTYREAISLLQKYAPAGKFIATMEKAPEVFYNSGTRGYIVGPHEGEVTQCTDPNGGVLLLTGREWRFMNEARKDPDSRMAKEFTLLERGRAYSIWKRQRAAP
jgi:hypothetical protein